MSTKVRLTITISELDMVKLRVVAARNRMNASTMARVWVESRLASIHLPEPTYVVQPGLQTELIEILEPGHGR